MGERSKAKPKAALDEETRQDRRGKRLRRQEGEEEPLGQDAGVWQRWLCESLRGGGGGIEEERKFEV